jgi:drug/metabolite transporter (DMT)-like permease
MPVPYDLLALGAAACWGLGSLLSVSPARHLGAFAYTRWRMLMVAGMLWAATYAINGWHWLPTAQFGTMALSGLVGIFIGDTANFSAMNRLGPRRTGVLFATNAVFSALLGFAVFGERMSLQTLLGASLTIAGVMAAILFGQRKSETHAWETDRGHPGVGIALGFLAALCQSIGTVIAKPVMAGDMDPITASAIRVSVACGAHFALLWCGAGAAQAHQAPTLRVLAQTAASGFVGMGLGMTALLLALKRGDVGVVAILSSVTPILILPLLWLRLRRPPARGAWLGAALAVGGTALMLSR